MENLSDLNGDLRSIAEVIGRNSALYLVSQCPRYKTEKRAGKGQILLYVPKPRNLDLDHNLVKILGYQDAAKIAQVFGGELLILSQCSQIILSARNEGIRRMKALGFSLKELVDIFNISERVIYSVLEKCTTA